MSSMSLTAIASSSTLKSNTYLLNPIFFILSTGKSFKMFPKQSGFATISESFALDSIIYVLLTNN